MGFNSAFKGLNDTADLLEPVNVFRASARTGCGQHEGSCEHVLLHREMQ